MGDSHVDGNLVDNVAESGEESEDEWNYYKVEGEQEQNPSEEVDKPSRSETPCQDNVSGFLLLLIVELFYINNYNNYET